MANNPSSHPVKHSSREDEGKDIQTSVRYVEASFSGPLPDPASLKAYDIVVPGLAERIVVNWESQFRHRIAMEKLVIESDVKRAVWGMVSAFVISLFLLLVAAILAFTGHETVAAILAGLDLSALAGVFIYGTNSRKQERITKAKIMTGQSDDEE